MPARHTAAAPTDQVGAAAVRRVALLLEHVLDLLAGLLQAAGRALGAALGLHLPVVGRLAEGLLGAALELLGLVVELVIGRHRGLPLVRWRAATRQASL